MRSLLFILALVLGIWAIYRLVFLPRRVKTCGLPLEKPKDSPGLSQASPGHKERSSDLTWPRTLEAAVDKIYSHPGHTREVGRHHTVLEAHLARTTLMGLIKSFEKISALQASLQSLSSPGLSMREVGDIVARDPILSAQVLRAANAPAFGLAKEVHSVHTAVNILGLNYVKSILLYRHMPHNLFATKVQRKIFGQLWAHMTITAILAAHLARLLGDLEETSLYMAGLLHDIGKLVLVPLITDDLTQVYPASLVQEHALLSITHVDVAQLLAERDQSASTKLWDLVLGHHLPTQAPSSRLSLSQPQFRVLTVLFVANQLAKLLSTSGEFQEMDAVFLDPLHPAYVPHLPREKVKEMLFHHGLMQEMMNCAQLVQVIQSLA